MAKKIFVFPKYSAIGPSSRYRMYQYFERLEYRGLECVCSPLLDEVYLNTVFKKRKLPLFYLFKRFIQRCTQLILVPFGSTVWVEYELFPYFPSFFEFFLKLKKCKLIFEYDDAVHLRYKESERILTRVFCGEKIAHNMKLASIVVVANKFLYEYAAGVTRAKIVLVPTVVNFDKYKIHVKQRSDRYAGFHIVWIGTPVTQKYLHLIAPDLRRFLSAFDDAFLSIVGASDEGMDLPANKVRCLEWSEASEGAILARCHVGVMPLVDDSWSKGKSGLKLIQYMACGLPVIASPVGVNRKIVDHGRTGFLVTEKMSWLEALESLKNNQGLRDEMGRKGSAKAERYYSLRSTEFFLGSCLS